MKLAKNIEIERKFLVKGDFLPFSSKKERIVQAYLSIDPERAVRIRIKGEKAFLTDPMCIPLRTMFTWRLRVTFKLFLSMIILLPFMTGWEIKSYKAKKAIFCRLWRKERFIFSNRMGRLKNGFIDKGF